MIARSLIIALLCSIAESRVTFTTSEVLDDVDLKGPTGTTATFKCYAGCKIYSPTSNDKIVIYDGAGKKYQSLKDLADIQTGNTIGTPIELPVSTALYTLKNTGAADPSFLFYAVEKGATNYNAKVVYVDAAKKFNVNPKTDSLLTVMSSSGAVRFSSFVGDFTDALPAVYAMPADSIYSTSCRAVYQAINAPSVPNTSFPVYSPIATIDFKKAGTGKSVVVSGEVYVLTSTGTDASAVYVSPGYVGCDNVGDSLYTSLSPITSFDSSFKVSDSNGLSVVCDGDYSIEKQADAIQLTVNNDVQELYGKKPYSKIYNANSFQIGVKWTKRAGSVDRFAMQIDVMTDKEASGIQTTTKSGHLLTIGSSLLMIVSAAIFRL